MIETKTMITKEELLANATNEHDRELMREELYKFEKVQSKSYTLIGIAIFLGFVGIFGMNFINDYFIISLLPIPFLLIFAQLNMIKGIGVI